MLSLLSAAHGTSAHGCVPSPRDRFPLSPRYRCSLTPLGSACHRSPTPAHGLPALAVGLPRQCPRQIYFLSQPHHSRASGGAGFTPAPELWLCEWRRLLSRVTSARTPCLAWGHSLAWLSGKEQGAVPRLALASEVRVAWHGGDTAVRGGAVGRALPKVPPTILGCSNSRPGSDGTLEVYLKY